MFAEELDEDKTVFGLRLFNLFNLFVLGLVEGLRVGGVACT